MRNKLIRIWPLFAKLNSGKFEIFEVSFALICSALINPRINLFPKDSALCNTDKACLKEIDSVKNFVLHPQ